MDLVEGTSEVFNDLFTLENIKQTYEKIIRIQNIRGIDRMGYSQFNAQADQLWSSFLGHK